MICATEGFVGVLFASLCSAIFVAKVSRLQNFAQVDFTDVVCIRYGSGVQDETETHNTGLRQRTNTEDVTANDDDSETKLECPILEFRLVNRMHNVPGGEIVDSRVNVVASIDEANVSSQPSGGALFTLSKEKPRREGTFE